MKNNFCFFAFLLLLFVGIVSFSCQFNQNKHEKEYFFPGNTWNRFIPFEDTIEIIDIKKAYDLDVSFSVWNGFEHSLIPLEVVVFYPNGQKSVFLKYFSIKDLNGNHLGTISGDVWTIDMNIFSDRTFPETGKYIISIQNLTQYYDLSKVYSIKNTLKNSSKKKRN